MNRYFAELAYNGSGFSGWQSQPGQRSVQSTIEKAFYTILRKEVAVVGCGRTDAGVHSKQYFLHFDWEETLPDSFLLRFNKVLGANIVVYRIFLVAQDAHARFNATSRSYEYHINLIQNPFTQQTAYFFPQAARLDIDAMQAAAQLLLSYEEFYPFCKSNSDAKTMRCELERAEWVKEEKTETLTFHISANRFLRGMVRLIVGMCLNVGMGKISLEEVRTALDTQSRLERSYSVPPQGLFLTAIKYPFL